MFLRWCCTIIVRAYNSVFIDLEISIIIIIIMIHLDAIPEAFHPPIHLAPSHAQNFGQVKRS